jgi:hypothetical protein
LAVILLFLNIIDEIALNKIICGIKYLGFELLESDSLDIKVGKLSLPPDIFPVWSISEPMDILETD